MFTKLLKHEFRATRNAMGLLCLTALGCGLLAGLDWGYLFWAEENFKTLSNTVEILSVLVMFFSVLVISLCGLSALILMIVRFYRSRFTDEGYLTFTLPVNAHQVLLSSLLSSGVNMLLAFVTVFVSFVLMCFTGMLFVKNFWPDLQEILPEIWKAIRENMSWETAGYIFLVLADGLAALVYNLVTIMLSVTIGALAAKKHKILAAVAVYYGLDIVMSVLLTIFFTSILAAALPGTVGSPAAMMAIPGIIFLAIAAGGYFLMHHLVDRKLNLP